MVWVHFLKIDSYENIEEVFKKSILPILGDRNFNWVGYVYLHRKCGLRPPSLSFTSPTGFNEKVIWLKMFYRHPNANQFADKVRAKELAVERCGFVGVIKNIKIVHSVEGIDFSALPERFVIRTNHSSGWNIIVRNKCELDIPSVERKLRGWMKRNYGRGAANTSIVVFQEEF